jgi:Ser/Thr protein kinase RdoA (MazF antagonist)
MKVLQSWSELSALALTPLAGGLINETWQLGDPPVAVLQRLHPIFAPEVNLDIAAITAHLAAQGLLTPRVIPTDGGALWALDDEGRCWRALSWVPGVTHHKLLDEAMAREAGALVARWHRSTAQLKHQFAFGRVGVHDTRAHLEKLRQALDVHSAHRLYDKVAPVAQEIVDRFASWQGREHGPVQLSHGDLKISNLRFDADGRGLCLLDLDTMGPLSLDLELGDAWRSWCNPASEDALETRFDVALFEASAIAYLSERPLPAEERQALPGGIERICLELSARFATDSLQETYFGWNPLVAATRGEHNLLRAQGQLALARSVRGVRGRLEKILERSRQ